MTDLGISICIRPGCGTEFPKKREKQRYCSTRCRVGDAVGRHREAITEPSPSTGEAITGAPAPSYGLQKPSEEVSYGWGPPGEVLKDDYPLEYYEDGFPKIPDILKRF
jgi:hypothetical protein